MEKILWFDLEETMIQSWENPTIINFLKIQKIIKTEKPDKIGIFSFAIWDEKDLLHFNTILKPFIEKVWQIKIDLCPSKLELFTLIKDKSKKQFDSDDFDDFWDKSRAFVDFISLSELNKFNNILFDDMVTNCILNFDTFTINIKNINNIS